MVLSNRRHSPGVYTGPFHNSYNHYPLHTHVSQKLLHLTPIPWPDRPRSLQPARADRFEKYNIPGSSIFTPVFSYNGSALRLTPIPKLGHQSSLPTVTVALETCIIFYAAQTSSGSQLQTTVKMSLELICSKLRFLGNESSIGSAGIVCKHYVFQNETKLLYYVVYWDSPWKGIHWNKYHSFQIRLEYFYL